MRISVSRQMIFLGLICCLQARASEVEWRGFLDVVGVQTSDNMGTDDGAGPKLDWTTFSRMGMSGTNQINDQYEGMFQAVADGSDNGRFNPEIIYALVNYKPTGDSYYRFGRIVIPVWNISDYRLVGALYPWVRPPVEVYSLNPIESVNGLSGNWLCNWGLTTGNFELYIGSGAVNSPVGYQQRLVSAQDIEVLGGSFTLQGAHWSWRSSYAHSPDANFSLQTSQTQNLGGLVGVPYLPVSIKISYPLNAGWLDFTSTGLTLDFAQWKFWSELASEKAQRIVNQRMAAYATLGRSFLDEHLLIHYTYSNLLKNDNDVTSHVRSGRQISNTFGAKYNLNASTSLKFDYSQVHILDNSFAMGIYTPDPYSLATAPGLGGPKSYSIYSAAVELVF